MPPKKPSPTSKPKQTASVIALIVLFVLILSVVLVRSLQTALPTPYPSPLTDPSAGPPAKHPIDTIYEMLLGKPLPIPEFDARDAINHVLDDLIKLGPRPFSSEANIATGDFLYKLLVEWRDEGKHGAKRMVIERDQRTVFAGPFDFPRQSVNTTYSLALDNIIVKLKGRCELQAGTDCPAILISSHYDSVVSSPGVTDDGIAVTTMMELVRMLVQDDQPPFPNSLIFLINNAEECGLLGARHFKSHPWYSAIRAAINLEGSGSGGPAMLFRTSDLSLISAYASRSTHPHASVIGNDVMNLKLVNSVTDYNVYVEQGEDEKTLPVADIAFYRKRYFYHTKKDAWDKHYVTSLQHMGDSTIKMIATLAWNQKFMEAGSSSVASLAPGVYWHELYGQMAYASFDTYFVGACALMIVNAYVLIVAVKMAQSFVATYSKYVQNFSIVDLTWRFLSALCLSIILPVGLIYFIDVARPFAIYGNPIPTRLAVLTSSILGSLLPFTIGKSPFSMYPSTGDHQEMLNWHLSQIGCLISWIPLSIIVSVSSFCKIGMFYGFAVWVAFGILSVLVDWYGYRPWFGNERKGADEDSDSTDAETNATKGSAIAEKPESLNNRKAPAPSAAPSISKVGGKKSTQTSTLKSMLPSWFPVFITAIVLPLASQLETLHSLLLALEPTIQDGTPALAIVGIVSVFASAMSISFLPYLLTDAHTISRSVRNLSVITLLLSWRLLGGRFDKPLSVPSSIVPFTADFPLKVVPLVEMDLTDRNATNVTYKLAFNKLALPLLRKDILPEPLWDCSGAFIYYPAFISCSASEESLPLGINAEPKFPSLDKALEIEHQVVEKDILVLRVRSEYSRICFVKIVDGFGSGRASSVWPGDIKSKPDKTVSAARSYTAKLNQYASFVIEHNFGKMNVVGRKSVKIKVGCFVDDLAYLPAWAILEESVLPDWALLMGVGNGALSVFREIEIEV